MSRRKHFAALFGLLSVLLVGAGDDECRPGSTRLSKDEYFRVLSLDLRGVIPSEEEYAAIANRDDVPAELIDRWLASDEFAERAYHRHRALLWPTISNQLLINYVASLLPVANADGSYRWYRWFGSRGVRGGEGPPCLDEPATFDADGRPVTRDDGTGARVEGWVEVHPYWAPETTFKVCALDAQEAATSWRTGARCDVASSISTECGCGPNLSWCYLFEQHDALIRSFDEDFAQRVRSNVQRGEPYAELFSSRRVFINGPIANFYRRFGGMQASVALHPGPFSNDELPNLGINDEDVWVEMELPEEHAGVLSSPVYLLRFQSNRARANRFYESFLCQGMEPPSGGLPIPTPAEQRMNDLQERPGCRYCHAILEPAAAYWGRWSQQSAIYLDPETYPEFRADCAACARGMQPCSALCANRYVVSALSPESQPYLGMLRAYEFVRPEHREHIERGPVGLVQEGLADGRFLSCTVRRTAEWLLGRQMSAGDDALAGAIEASLLNTNLRYRDAVRAIVTSETYRRTR